MKGKFMGARRSVDTSVVSVRKLGETSLKREIYKMATKPASSVSATAIDSELDINVALDEDFAVLPTSRYMFNAEKCVNSKGEHYAVTGYLIGLDRFDSDVGTLGYFETLVVRLTHPTMVLESAGSDKLKLVEAGENVHVIMTEELKSLKELALADMLPVVCIRPIEKRGIGSGKSMWHYNVKYDRNVKRMLPRSTVAPETMNRLTPVSAANNAKELPAS
jgi:hypothetical protein